MSLRDDIVAWASTLEGSELNAANGAKLTVTGAKWQTQTPYWLAMDLEVRLDWDVGPDAKWLLSDADVGWAALLGQIGLPAALTLAGHDRRILDPTRLRVVMRLALA